MINFIKKAVESVEGIKSFLFNTDYRNNFDIQNVEFPCCVLTPIMNTKYDLNNFIHESAELQISIVDTAPYEYTGDDLYNINKRCSDLLLQVIANLQVKTKFNKELTFEFILPSGDELVSGVMCNITATMKQGSCIGAPSYVEVVVQPIVRKSITTNGTYHITPSSGFNAMREVEVDVRIEEKAEPKLQSKAILITTNNSNANIVADEGFDGLGNVAIDVQIPTEERSVDITRNGEVEILPTSADAMTKVTANVQVPPPPLEEKQVTITRNGTTEIVPTSEYGLSRVEVVAEVAPNLQDKQVDITENGTQIITADEGFDGLNSVEVNCSIYEELNFDNLGYDVNDKAQIFGVINNKFTFAQSRYLAWDKKNTSGAQFFDSAKFGNSAKMEFAPKIDTSNLTNASYMYRGTSRLEYFPHIDVSKITTAVSMFQNSGIKKLPDLVFQSLKYATDMFKGSSLTDISNLYFPNLTSANNMFHTSAITYISSSSVNLSRLSVIDQLCNGCIKLTEVGQLDTALVSRASYTFGSCTSLHSVALLNFSNATYLGSIFHACSNLTNLGGFIGLKTNISINPSPKLTPLSIHNVIEQALGNFTLTLHATAKANWEASEYYEQDLITMTEKSITIA